MEGSISIFGITMGLFSGLRPRSGLSRTTFLRDLGVAALIMLAVLGATTVIDSLWHPLPLRRYVMVLLTYFTVMTLSSIARLLFTSWRQRIKRQAAAATIRTVPSKSPHQ